MGVFMRIRDVRHAYRLVNDCRLLGADPNAWRLRLAEGLCDLFNAQVGVCAEVENLYDLDTRVLHYVDAGWRSEEHKTAFMLYQIDGARRSDPVRKELDNLRRDFLVAPASTLVDRNRFRQSPTFARYFAPSRLGDYLVGVARLSQRPETFNLILIMRDVDAPDFDRAEARLLRVLLLELAPLIGPVLADASDPILKLTPRLQQGLRALLMGHSEAEAASHLGISPKTFHKYVTALYKHFDVSSRAMLQARFAATRSMVSDPVETAEP